MGDNLSMTETYLHNEATSHFRSVYLKGYWLKSALSYPFLGKRSIISLSDLTKIYKPEGELYSGMKEVLVSKILGSEDRSNDFAEGFLPGKSWMQNRWIKVCVLMLKGNLEEPIDVIEYGGVYFVRDGNHRVSVAKKIKREFLRAKVTKLKVPFSIPETLTQNKLINFKKMAQFQKSTSFFTNVLDAKFDIRRKQSWEIMEKELKDWSPMWFDRHKEFLQEKDIPKQQQIWYEWLNKSVMEDIKKSSLHYLFPGWGDTDVAMEIIKLWNSYSNPDDISVEELYDIFIKRTRKRRFLLTPIHFIIDKIHYLRRTAWDERCFFYRRSGIGEIRPEFKLPSDLGKRFWRNLYKDLFKVHYNKMRKELGRSPYHVELVSNWYDNVWIPRSSR